MTATLMKTWPHPKSILFPTLGSALLVAGCVSQIPVDGLRPPRDTEQEILDESGISGSKVGVAAAAVAAYCGAYLLAKAEGFSEAAAHEAAMRAAPEAMRCWIGYAHGKQQSGRIPAKSLGRDRLARLVEGARAFNRAVAAYHNRLKPRIADAAAAPAPDVRTWSLAALQQEANRSAGEVKARVDERQKAVDNPQWTAADKERYRVALRDLQREQKLLGKTIRDIETTKQSGVSLRKRLSSRPQMDAP